MALVEFNGLLGNLVQATRPNAAILMIAGGGTIDCLALDTWQYFLSKEGATSLSFDFAGIGHSHAISTPDSLKSRLVQAITAYDYLASLLPKCRINVVGRSMGAPIAVRLAGERPVESILLVNPAAYSDRAWNVDFGPEFRAILHSSNWEDSSDFNLAGRAGTKLFVVYGERDMIIPLPIQQKYLEVGHKREGALLLKGVKHNLFLWPKTESEKRAQKELFRETSPLLAH